MKNKIIFKNFSSRIVFSGFNILLGFIVTPLLIKYLGKEDFSLYKIAYDWLSTIGFLEQALTSAVLAILVQVSNEKRDQYTIYTFKKLFSFSLLFILLSTLMIPFLPKLFNIPVNKIANVKWGFFIGSLSFIFLPMTVLKVWIEFKEKSYLLNSSRMIQSITQSVIAILLAWFAFGIIGQFSAFILGHIVFSTIIFSIFKKNSELIIDHELTQHEKKSFKTLFLNSNKNGIILSLCSKLSFFSDTLLLGFFFNPVLILPFTLTQRLILMIQENLQSIGNSSWASLVDLHRNGNQVEFEKQLFSMTRMIIFFSLILLLPLLFINKAFITIWVGEQFYAGFMVTFVAILNTYFMGVFSLWGWCLSGSGRIKVQIPVYIINALVNFCVGFMLVKSVGIIGPIIGTLVGFIFVYSWLLPKLLHNELQVDKAVLYRNLFKPILIIIPISMLAMYFQDLLFISNYIQLALVYLFMSLAIFSILFWIYLNQDERQFAKNIIFKKLKI